MSTKFKFPKSKKIHEAIFEIAVDTHSLFCPFWQIFLPVYNLPSILALWIVLLFANFNSIDIPIANVQVRICWTFFPSELPFPSWVHGLHLFRINILIRYLLDWSLFSTFPIWEIDPPQFLASPQKYLGCQALLSSLYKRSTKNLKFHLYIWCWK